MLLVLINCTGAVFVVSGWFVKPLKKLFLTIGKTHSHDGIVKARGKDESIDEYFMRVATADAKEGGWEEIEGKAWRLGSRRAADEWVEDNECKGTWRCKRGDGQDIDQARVVLEIAVPLEEVRASERASGR